MRKNVKNPENNVPKAGAESKQTAPKTDQKPKEVSREQFGKWVENDFHAARAFLNLISTRPHILEQIKDALYETTVLQNKTEA